MGLNGDRGLDGACSVVHPVARSSWSSVLTLASCCAQALEVARARQLQQDRQLVSSYEAEVASHVVNLERALKQVDAGRAGKGTAKGRRGR
jgi:hypothetical protein